VKINESKSIQCTFTLRKGICPPISLNEQVLYPQNTRYLGVIIDQRLTWSPHLRNKLLSLNNRFRLLRSLLTSSHIKLPIKLLIYISFILNQRGRTESNYGALQKFQTLTVFNASKAKRSKL